MKLLMLIFSTIILMTSACHDRSKSNPELTRVEDTESKVQVLDEYWPFEDTLRQSDPYVSELLVE